MSQTREPPHPRRIFRQKKEHLPHDIVPNILANLPAKSVLRFRCVSKTWDSSITTPSFISTHLNLNNNNNNLAYLINFASTPFESQIHNTTTFKSTIPRSIGGYDPTFNRISEYPIPSGFPSSCYLKAGSCNGLVCFTQHKCEYYPFITGAIYLWNPSIRKLKRLPDFSPNQHEWFSTGFAYQSNTNDYKVVKISQMSIPEDNVIETEAEAEGGALHWLGYVRGAASRYMILSFDVNNDKFGEIALPDGQQQQLLPQGVMAKQNRLMVFKGKLGFITLDYFLLNHINNDVYKDYMRSHANSCFIWVMGEYGVHESWSKLFFVQFENVISVRFFGCTSLGLQGGETEDDRGTCHASP
ncbi:hypothetical protein ACB092_07G182400 [Castanea dentata]